MNRNIHTHNAKLELIEKFLDYANCADASYALLEYTNKDYMIDESKNENGDKQTQGHKFNNQNSTYARAIEARFQKDKIINQSLCFPCTNTCLNNETINNDITKIKLDDELSQRTINFVNRFKVLHYQPNTSSGFSATLFQNKQTKEYILSFRSTELSNLSQIWADLFATDIRHLLSSSTPKAQYDDMLNFYKSCARDYPQIKEKDSLTLTGHSLGGYLAQRFCPIICYNQ